MTQGKQDNALPGLEGPFTYHNGRTLYWDPTEGKYYDRGQDLYLTEDQAWEVETASAPVCVECRGRIALVSGFCLLCAM